MKFHLKISIRSHPLFFYIYTPGKSIYTGKSGWREKIADFVSKGMVKSAEKKLTTPIDTVANFLALIQDVIENNPRGCVSYTLNSATVAGVVRGSESYSGKVVYENALVKTVGRFQ